MTTTTPRPNTLIGHVGLADLRIAYGEFAYLVRAGDAFMRAECRSCGWAGPEHHFDGGISRDDALALARVDEQQHACQ